MRILALDWGTVRIGVAVSDPDGKIAFPLEKIIEAKGSIEEIKKIVNELGVERIILGLPKTLKGESSDSTNEAMKFKKQLQKNISIPVDSIDERLSSVAAGKTLDEQGMNSRKQREIKDNIAAQIILQQHLDTKK